ncbi:MAG: hypothetical protein JNJ94_11205 [Chlorobi bacterium]|nr:hypothetical protein [Chlorobiota bacterium]
MNNRHDDFLRGSSQAATRTPPRNKSAKTVFLGMIFAKSDIFARQKLVSHDSSTQSGHQQCPVVV